MKRNYSDIVLRTLFVDFNAYFASVEQQLRPELRGLPVGVVPVMAETSSCIAASYEAKKLMTRAIAYNRGNTTQRLKIKLPEGTEPCFDYVPMPKEHRTR